MYILYYRYFIHNMYNMNHCLRGTTVARRLGLPSARRVYIIIIMTGDTRDIELLLFNDDDFQKRKIVLNCSYRATVPMCRYVVHRRMRIHAGKN